MTPNQQNKCGVCGSGGKRACPGLGGAICPSCCGARRGSKIECPASCPHFPFGTEAGLATLVFFAAGRVRTFFILEISLRIFMRFLPRREPSFRLRRPKASLHLFRKPPCRSPSWPFREFRESSRSYRRSREERLAAFRPRRHL